MTVTDSSVRSAVRRQNLSMVASLVHRHGTISRSAITRATGLSRSAVSSLVGDLQAAGIVRQSAAVTTPSTIGRPSPQVESTDRFLAVSVSPDVNGVRVAFVALGGRVVARAERVTQRPPTPSLAAELTADAIAELRSELPESTLVSICATIPGRVTKDRASVTFAPHLQWRDVAFAALLAARTGLRAEVIYDAYAGMFAELMWGVATDQENVVSFYGGPGGIGAAAVVDGNVLSGAIGGAARLSHTLVAPGGRLCECGNRGCLTTVVSRHDTAAAFGMPDADLAELRTAILTTRDETLRAGVTAQVDHLGVALRQAMHFYDPSMIVLGGFMEILLETGRDRLIRALAIDDLRLRSDIPDLVVPALGADQLLAGASHMVFEKVLHDPLDGFAPLLPGVARSEATEAG